ncbi:MAG: nucleotide-diphospho-sugar transferase [Verrucomicrobiota bacterium]
MDTALLLIHFNRPDVTRRQVDALRSIAPKRVWVLCDAPRPDRAGEDKKVDEVRSILDTLPWDCKAKYLCRKQNLGVRENISSGISWFLEEAGEGIILEDDCIPSASFFDYCSEMLKRYRNEERVFSVSGYTGIASDLPIETSYCFSNYFSCWGWATWDRAWKFYDPEMFGFKDKVVWRSICNRVHPGLRQRLYWNMIFNRVVNNRADSWAYRFLLSMWRHQGLSINPKRNLIDNIGFLDQAENTTGMKERITPNFELEFPIVHPRKIIENEFLDLWIENNCHSKSLPIRLTWLLNRLIQRLSRYYKILN